MRPLVAADTTPMHRNPLVLWRRLTLWPRLAIGVTLGFLALFAGFSLLGIRAVDASTTRILHERLAITRELAEDFDGLLEHRFANLAAFDPRPASPATERRLLAEIFHASGGGFTAVVITDGHGRILGSLGSAARSDVARAGPVFAARALRAGRAISAPFRDPRGVPVVALAVRLSPRRVALGTLDLAAPEVLERLDAARRLGATGHAELVGPGGIALASTEPGPPLRPGEHLAFYRHMLRARRPGIENVEPTPDASEAPGLGGQEHTMAFVRLRQAPWGVALGGTTAETYAPAQRLRRTLMLAGGGALAALWLLTLVGARLLVRPVRDLTRAAEEMASGDLEQPVRVTEGGEIGVLAESLETMRSQLKGSLETVRRWGEELELKVADRTVELNARNRQLAAVGAIMRAADEAHDLDGVLHRCVEVVLEQTSVDAAVVELRDASLVASAVRDGGDAVDDAWSETLPLRGHGGRLGELTVSRRRGVAPDPEEQAILVAMSEQIALAVESARLATELRRLEAQHEVQRVRSELISAVSHELRTPLGFIKSYATTLLRDDAPIEDTTRRHFLEIIDEETDKLGRMIDDLLDASRLQAGRLPIEREPLSLTELVERVVEKVRPGLEGAGHPVALRLPADAVPVLADARRIEQVLDNLLENASRYSEPDSPIEVGLVAEEGEALVSIRDQGDGLAPGELDQIFQPFFRGRSASASRHRGAGLGLAICRGIVEAHGGRVWGESGRDRTTTFLVALPLA